MKEEPVYLPNEYTVVTAERLENLIELVNQKMSVGWQPIGTLAHIHQGYPQTREYLAQPMIRVS